MAVTIRTLDGAEATVRRGVWTATTLQLRQQIRALHPERATFSVDPDPDMSQAVYVLQTLIGEIVKADPPRWKSEPDVVY